MRWAAPGEADGLIGPSPPGAPAAVAQGTEPGELTPHDGGSSPPCRTVTLQARRDREEVSRMAKGMPKEVPFILACAGLAWDLVQADKHKRTCPKCQGRDFLAIALDLAHLAQTA